MKKLLKVLKYKKTITAIIAAIVLIISLSVVLSYSKSVIEFDDGSNANFCYEIDKIASAGDPTSYENVTLISKYSCSIGNIILYMDGTELPLANNYYDSLYFYNEYLGSGVAAIEVYLVASTSDEYYKTFMPDVTISNDGNTTKIEINRKPYNQIGNAVNAQVPKAIIRIK